MHINLCFQLLLHLVLIFIAVSFRSPLWTLAAMYLLQKFSSGIGGSFDRGKDEYGGEVARNSTKAGYGFSMVQGRRPYMEDVLFASTCFGNDSNTCFFGMFDGHSGKRAALWAKEHLAKNLASELETSPGTSPGVHEALTRAFLRTDGEFLDKASREGLNDGCTVTTAYIRSDASECASAEGPAWPQRMPPPLTAHNSASRGPPLDAQFHSGVCSIHSLFPHTRFCNSSPESKG